MPTQRTRRTTLSSWPNPAAGLQQEPLTFNRAPTTSDSAEIGTIWVWPAANSWWILTSSTGGTNVWTAATAGAIAAPSMTINPGDLTVTAGDLAVSAGDATIFGATSTGTLAAGNTAITGTLSTTGAAIFSSDVSVAGNFVATGDFDLVDTASISLTSTNNAAGAIALLANGGVNETVTITSAQGTGVASVDLQSTVGGITLSAGKAAATAINLTATNAAGGITGTFGTSGLTLTGTNGSFNLTTGTGAINIGADAVQHNITIGNITGTTGVSINAGTGAVGLGNNATAHITTVGSNNTTASTVIQGGSVGITIATATNGTLGVTTGTGQIDLSSDATATTVNLGAGAGAGSVKTVVIGSLLAGSGTTVRSGTVGTALTSTGDISATSTKAAGVVSLVTNGGVAESIYLHSTQGTAATSINLVSTAGGITLSGALASINAINLTATDAAGGITETFGTAGMALTGADGGFDLITGTGTINLGADATTSALNFGVAAGAAVKTVIVGSTVNASATTIQAGTGNLSLTSTGTGTLTSVGNLAVSSSAGTALFDSVGALELNSSGAAISIANDAVNQAVNISTAGDRVTTIGKAAGAAQLVLNSGSAGITLVAANGGAMGLTVGAAFTLAAVGDIGINSTGGAINIGTGINNFAVNLATDGQRAVAIGNVVAGTTVNLAAPAQTGIAISNSVQTSAILVGSGVPGFNAPYVGCLYLNTDPAATAVQRLWVAVDAAGTWAFFTASA